MAEFSTKEAAAIGQSAPVDPNSPYDSSSIKGKFILITGGASGIGAAMATHWASLGAYVMIGDRDTSAGEKLVAKLRQDTECPHHFFHEVDVTDWQSQVDMFRAAIRSSPVRAIDCVVPCAGVSHDNLPFENPRGLDTETPPRPRFKIIDVNFIGVMYTSYLALFWLPRNDPDEDPNKPVMPGHTKRDRHLLFVGSIGSLMPLVNAVQYTASKHAVAGLFRTLRSNAWRKGIRVNMICPYFIDTPMVPSVVLAFLAGGGLGKVEDCVEASTRFVADNTVWGRAVVIGPRMKVEDMENGEMKLVEIPKEEGDGQASFECWAHDYENMESFVYRYTRLMVALTVMRGWIGWFADLVSLMLGKRNKK